MRQALIAGVTAALAAWAGGAVGDLYRWVDPETGSVKFSSYPPPWYGKPELERRSPKVERIPAGQEPPPAQPEIVKEPAAAAVQRPAPAGESPAAPDAAGLETVRKALLQRLAALHRPADFERAGPGLQQQLAAYQALVAELDRIDPKGAVARHAETQSLLDKLRAGMGAQSGPKPPTAPPRER